MITLADPFVIDQTNKHKLSKWISRKQQRREREKGEEKCCNAQTKEGFQA